jgi:RimJ/RimL family protein N-acetyltransferase
MLYVNRPLDRAATAAFYAGVQKHWAEHGFGFYAVESIEDGPVRGFIGLVGIAHPTFVPELAARPELGWRLARHAWGRGLATEAARAVRDHAFERLALHELISIVHPDNARSQRVATKLGMTAVQRVRIPALEREADVWRLASPHPR